MTSHTRFSRKLPRSSRHPLALAVALSLMLPIAAGAVVPAVAINELPTVPKVTSGSISIPSSAAVQTNPFTGVVTTTLNISQQTRGAVVDWTTFNIGKNAVVEINNPNWHTQSVTLNRVTGPDPSQIFGRLTAEGSVFLINPAGITFAAGSSVNVGGLVASTLDYDRSDDDFVKAVDAGGHAFSFVRGAQPMSNRIDTERANVSGDPAASIVASGGVVALLADVAANAGNINADGGKVALGSGNKVTLDFQGDGLTMLTINVPSTIPGSGVVGNLGTIHADGGQVVMRVDAQQAGAGIVAGGTIRARSLQNQGGKIILSAIPGADYGGGVKGAGGVVVVRDGQMDSSADVAGVAGGEITLEGDLLQFLGTNASFNAGGNGAANGTLNLTSAASVLLSSTEMLGKQQADSVLGNYSLIPDSAVNSALNHATNVNLRAIGKPASKVISGAYDGSIWMMDGDDTGAEDANKDTIYLPSAQISKISGGDAKFLVQANRDIYMMPRSSIRSTSGALSVDFDADHAGNEGAQLFDTYIESGGQISLLGASITTNGGPVRFFGQGDPLNGRATGSSNYLTGDNPGVSDQSTHARSSGIRLVGSTIDACAQATSGACTGDGGVALRGHGVDETNNNKLVDGGTGVDVASSTIFSAIAGTMVDGIGGTGGYGVAIRRNYLYLETMVGEASISNDSFDASIINQAISGIPSVLRSAGSVQINGMVGGITGTFTPRLGRIGSGVGVIDGSKVFAGNNLSIMGFGADLSRSLPAAINAGDYLDPSNGVELIGATLQAGNGANLTVVGKAGSIGTAPLADDQPLPPAAVRISGIPAGGSVSFPSPAVPTLLAAAGGNIDVHSDEDGDMYIDNSQLTALASGGTGGSVNLHATNILLGANALLDAGSTLDAGRVDVHADNVLAMDSTAGALADSTGEGHGGRITFLGDRGLYAFGSLSANGGATGGNGGSVETSGSGLQLNGLRVQAGARNGVAGTWLIDPFEVTIGNGNGTGVLPLDPFVPLATATVRDGEINYALDHGSDVTITTGTGGAGSGNITVNSGVNILRSAGVAPVTLRLDANGSIAGNYFSVQSTAGAMNIVFDVDANGVAPYQGIQFFGAQLKTNGGDIAMFGQNDPLNGYATDTINGIYLDTSLLDTRLGQNDANSGGSVILRGRGGYYGGGTGVTLADSTLHTATGDIDVVGLGRNGGSGVSLNSNVFSGSATITTTSGNLSVTGFGSSSGVGGGRTYGLKAVAYVLQTGSGSIDLRGHGGVDSGSNFSDGIRLDSRQRITSNGGVIALAGSSDGSGTGVALVSSTIDTVTGLPYAAPVINSGGGTIIVRAHNDGLTDALVFNGTLTSTGTVNLRPGGVDGNGNLVEYVADAVALGGTRGFALNATELNRISAGHLVLGSDIQQGGISVSTGVVYAHDLTLQSGAGGGVAVNAAIDVGVHTLGLISAGAITQTAPITAASLLAVSSGASVLLANANNQISSSTLAGSAAGNFTFINAGTVGLGDVSATGFAAAVNAPLSLFASGVSGSDVLVRAVTGDMLLNADVTGVRVDLVSAGIINNAGAHSITAVDGWRVWGNTWVGETRGDLTGDGNLPNLYGCAFASGCGSSVVVPSSGNHFLYAAQPTATINLADSSREYGLTNAAFNYGISGMILGDSAAQAIIGSPITTATQASNVGSYELDGSFFSPAGYLINIIAGALAITPATITYIADPYTRVYGDANSVLNGELHGFRLSDTQANATVGNLAFATSATQASDVGTYAINGGGLSAINYVFVQATGNANALTVSPATLTYVANSRQRSVGVADSMFDGSVRGLRNGDTLSTSTNGTLRFNTSANANSPTGRYAINGSGLSASNYIFTQASGNAVALTITPPLGTYTLDFVRDTPVTYVYDRNFGIVGLCPATDLAGASRDKDGDTLAREWSRVRSRPNLANCVSTRQENSCGDF